MAGPTGLDQSWSVTDAGAAQRAGVKVISQYLSWDPSKNITANKVRAYHAHGIASLINWEAMAGAPLNGAAQGRADAVEAVRQLRALIDDVGYAPSNRLAIYFSCDRDVSSEQIAGPVAAYYRAAGEVCHAAGFGVGAYGEADVVDYLAAHGITDSEWQTYAWSGGRLSAVADFYQYLNGQTLGGASVDFDRIIHAETLGAWWPHDSALDTDGGNPLSDLTDKQIAQLAEAISAAVWQHITPESSDKDAPGHAMSTYVVWASRYASQALAQGQENSKALATVSQLLGAAKQGVVARVASLQASVAALPKTIGSAPGTVDAAVIADAVAAKVRELKITLTGKAA